MVQLTKNKVVQDHVHLKDVHDSVELKLQVTKDNVVQDYLDLEDVHAMVEVTNNKVVQYHVHLKDVHDSIQLQLEVAKNERLKKEAFRQEPVCQVSLTTCATACFSI